MRSWITPLIAAAALAASVYPASAYRGFVTDLSNLRTGPGLGFPALVAIPPASPINILGCGPNWCQVQYSAVIGFIAAPLVVAGIAPPPVAAASTGGPFDILTAPFTAVGGVFGGASATTAAIAPAPGPVVAAY